MTIELARVGDTEWETLREVVFGAFGDDTDVDPDGERRIRALVERAWLARDGALGNQPIGGAATFDHVVRVPGGRTLPLAGLTMVGVRPTHRRRGVLNQLMRAHLDDARAHGYALSGLWASEASIYGRYGFGIAAECDALAIETPGLGPVAIPGDAPADAIEQIPEAAAREVLPAIYDRALADRPGSLVRSPVWWRERRFLESPHSRNGASKRRQVLARRAGELVGYLQYRQASSGDFQGVLSIVELVATDARAEASLWRYALTIGLFPKVKWAHAPVDCLAPYLVADNRRIERTREDTLWLHVLDVPRALAGRAYVEPPAAPIAFALADEPGATYRFDGTGAPRVDLPPDVTLTRAALGAIYLGHTRARQLARAGAITGDARAIAALDRAFAWPVAAWIPEVF